MVTKLKNITKKLPIYISIFIIVITGILIILFARNGIYRDALDEIEYGHSAAYARRISSDVKNICTYENNVIDDVKKNKAMGRDFSYLYAKMYVSENLDISIDHAAYNNEINLKLQQLANTINQNKMMLQTYNIQKKETLLKCIEQTFDTSTRRIVAVSNNNDIIHASILESNGYKYDKLFNHETGDSAVIMLLYKQSIFNKLKTDWHIFCICIKILNILAVISIIYLLYFHLITKKYIKIYAKKLKQFLHAIRIFFTGHIYYPLCTQKGIKLLFACSTILVALITIFLIIIKASMDYFKSLVPVGYSLNTLSDWVSPEWYNYAYIITNINYEKLFIICFVIYLLIFAVYHYFSSKVIKSCRILEDNIDKIYNGNYKIDMADGIHTAFYDSILKLSNIGEGFEKSLDEKVKSERMKTELITNVSHDLKTPLTSIISYVDLLERRDDLPSEAADYVKIISAKAIRLKNMVYDVFELAKTVSGELIVNKAKLSLNKLIIQTLTDMDDDVKKSALDIKLKLPEKDIFINSDGSRLYRVMQNIIGNALKYSLKGTRIYITEFIEKNTVILTIKNTASYEMDFTEEEVLERFVRGDKSRNTEGNGLGLSIAKEFTTACCGTFNIKIDGDQFNVIISFPIEDDNI